jgi:hypothetical protein
MKSSIITQIALTILPGLSGITLANGRYIHSAIFATIAVVILIIDKIKKD